MIDLGTALYYKSGYSGKPMNNVYATHTVSSQLMKFQFSITAEQWKLLNCFLCTSAVHI